MPCRSDFALVRKWTYLLFDEFFQQGDLEAKQQLPVSFLCDRSSTNVAKSQGGFISFVVEPLFVQVTQFMPGVSQLLENSRKNKAAWETHMETEREKLVYEKPENCDSESSSSHCHKVEVEPPSDAK